MKKTLLLCLITLMWFQSFGQSDSLISFTVKKKTACYVAGLISETGVLAAIAEATKSVEGVDSLSLDSLVIITITEADVVIVYRTLTGMAEGISSEPNKELHQTLLPLLPYHPWLAQEVSIIANRNSESLSAIYANGCQKIARIQTLQEANR